MEKYDNVVDTVNEKESSLKVVLRKLRENATQLESIRIELHNLIESLYGGAIPMEKSSDKPGDEPGTFTGKTQETFRTIHLEIENIKANVKILMNESEY